MSKTEARVRLRKVRPDDAPDINRWKNDQEIQALSQDHRSSETLSETQARVERWLASDPNETEHFGIELVATQQLIGFCHLAQIETDQDRCKVGIVIGESELWGKGYGREATSLLVARGFERGLTRIVAEVYASNARSVRMLEGAGFKLEGRLKCSVRRATGWVDELIFATVAPQRC